ncbi:MAG: hypothetical protein WCF36_00350 [Candidatus Nanopelagicales bacterium]
MRTHTLDRTSLAWGTILIAITGLLAVSIWTDITIGPGVVIPVALICAGALALIPALARSPTPPDPIAHDG